jgi:hypothetical protein
MPKLEHLALDLVANAVYNEGAGHIFNAISKMKYLSALKVNFDGISLGVNGMQSISASIIELK